MADFLCQQTRPNIWLVLFVDQNTINKELISEFHSAFPLILFGCRCHIDTQMLDPTTQKKYKKEPKVSWELIVILHESSAADALMGKKMIESRAHVDARLHGS